MARTVRDKGEPRASSYVFMWTLTDAGRSDVTRVKTSIRTASAMVRDLGGSCRLYVTTGGYYDMVGIARGLNDDQAGQLRLAVDALGTIRTTTFFKAQDFTLDEFDRHIDAAAKLLTARP
jgi:uncharacterized protein with GYD domain